MNASPARGWAGCWTQGWASDPLASMVVVCCCLVPSFIVTPRKVGQELGLLCCKNAESNNTEILGSGQEIKGERRAKPKQQQSRSISTAADQQPGFVLSSISINTGVGVEGKYCLRIWGFEQGGKGVGKHIGTSCQRATKPEELELRALLKSKRLKGQERVSEHLDLKKGCVVLLQTWTLG